MRRVPGAWRIAALVACVGAIAPLPVRAQDGDSPAARPLLEAEQSDSGPDRSRRDPDESAAAAASVEAPDELPEGADSGPAILVPRRELTAEEQRRERERSYDASEPLLPTVFQLFVGGGAPLDSSFDVALASHRYGDSPLMLIGDATLMTRIASWLWLGGRVGMRGRGWGRNDGPPAVAGGLDALAVAHVRAHLGPIVDLGVVLGAGLGWGGASIQGAGTWAFAPRLSGYLQAGFRVAQGARIGARVGWDWFSMYDLDRYGSDLELGGPVLAIGFELRR